MRYHTYTLVRPNGDLERVKIPSAWSPYEVAEKFRRTEVFLYVSARESVHARGYGKSTDTELVKGPAVVHIGPDRLSGRPDYVLTRVVRAPESDADAVAVLREAGII